MAPDEVEKMMIATCELQGRMLEAREKCRERFRGEERNEHNILRILIDGQIGLLAEDVTRKVAAVTEAISYQIGLSASCIRSHFLIGDLIMNGDLVEAIVLIRKQLESLARLHELDSKPLQKLAGKVPNITNILKEGAGRMYGDLSEVAHFSTPRVAEILHIFERGELTGPSLLPVYSERCWACMDMDHFVSLYFIAWMVEKLTAWYVGFDNAERKLLLAKTVMLALEAGVIRNPEDRGT